MPSVIFHPAPGEAAGCVAFTDAVALANTGLECLLADKGHGSDAVRATLTAQDIRLEIG